SKIVGLVVMPTISPASTERARLPEWIRVRLRSSSHTATPAAARFCNALPMMNSCDAQPRVRYGRRTMHRQKRHREHRPRRAKDPTINRGRGDHPTHPGAAYRLPLASGGHGVWLTTWDRKFLGSEPLAKLRRASARISDGRCTESWNRGEL